MPADRKLVSHKHLDHDRICASVTAYMMIVFSLRISRVSKLMTLPRIVISPSPTTCFSSIVHHQSPVQDQVRIIGILLIRESFSSAVPKTSSFFLPAPFPFWLFVDLKSAFLFFLGLLLKFLLLLNRKFSMASTSCLSLTSLYLNLLSLGFSYATRTSMGRWNLLKYFCQIAGQ